LDLVKGGKEDCARKFWKNFILLMGFGAKMGLVGGACGKFA
jgi:hypothetical protein